MQATEILDAAATTTVIGSVPNQLSGKSFYITMSVPLTNPQIPPPINLRTTFLTTVSVTWDNPPPRVSPLLTHPCYHPNRSKAPFPLLMDYWGKFPIVYILLVFKSATAG